MTTVVSADAPGKLFLTGEYAVLGGAPALVAAVDRRVEVRVRMEPGPDTVVVESIAEGNRHTASRGPLPAGDAGAVLAALRVARARGLEVGRVDVTVDSRAFLLGGRKLGLGRSAATVTAAIAALVGSEDGFAGALEAHADCQGGRGSGGDVAASFHGGVVEVQRGDQRLAVIARVLPAALHLVAGYTGEPALTDPIAATLRRRTRAAGHERSSRGGGARRTRDRVRRPARPSWRRSTRRAISSRRSARKPTSRSSRRRSRVSLLLRAGSVPPPSPPGRVVETAGSRSRTRRNRRRRCARRGPPRGSCRSPCRSRPRACATDTGRRRVWRLADSISDRKRSHLELCLREDVEAQGKTTLFEEVELVHDALPELAVDEVTRDRAGSGSGSGRRSSSPA